MKDEIQTAEIELPQLRQLVINNTLRISRNEESINEMKEKFNEEEKRRRERETYWDVAREEHDRAHREHEQDMRELRELLRDHSVRFDEDIKKSREEDEDRHRKFDEDMKRRREEDEERHRKFDEDLKKSRKEFDQRMKDLDKKIDKTHDAVTKLAKQVSSVTGNVVEGLISPEAHKMFIDAGYNVTRTCKRVQISDEERHTNMEIDVLMWGEKQLIAIEVKTECERHDIKKILKKMERFKTLCPEHADKEVLAGVAAIYFEDGVYDFAKESGLIIIHVKEDSVFELEPDFTLDPVPDKSTLRRF